MPGRRGSPGPITQTSWESPRHLTGRAPHLDGASTGKDEGDDEDADHVVDGADDAAGADGEISPAQTLQDLNYTFDPVGNIVEVTDAAQQSLLFTNAFATVPNQYVYDAVYRLLEGKGREHKSVGDTQRSWLLHRVPHRPGVLPESHRQGAGHPRPHHPA